MTSLNPEQLKAVEHLEGPALILAGAGSGKTRVLTTRIVRLVEEHGVPADRILAVTFTNKAAGEMRERVRGQLGREPLGMWLGTFHSLGARLLRRHAQALGWDSTFTIFDAEESLREIKRVMELVQLDVKRWKPKAMRGAISDAKNRLIAPSKFVEQHAEGFDLFLRKVASVYPEYQKRLRDQNAFDFDDLLVKPVELFEGDASLLGRYQERFSFILVDEYQDTNHAQFRFVELLARRHRNLMVVGDDDQGIYGWRGADISNILDFEKTFEGAATVRLERNYRSTATILRAANEVIRHNRHRKEKTLRTEREAGERLTVVRTADERDEAGWISGVVERRIREGTNGRYRDFAILYRTNAQSRALEDAFRRKGLPYQIVGGVRFYERREIQDLLAYLRLISNPLDSAAFARVVNVPKRGVGRTSQERLFQWAIEEGVPLLDAALRAEEVPGLPAGGARGIRRFAELVQRFSARAATLPVGSLVEELIEELDFIEHLEKEGPEGEDRIENVRELIAGAMDFDSERVEEWEEGPPDHFTELDLFLQHVALVTDIDRHDPESDAVTLMTLHNAKGLEFPVVFMAGLEDGLFPLGRAFDDPTELEEERRLFYVGVTRAEDKLFLTWAEERRRAGDVMSGQLSTFARDIPEELVEEEMSERLRRESEARAEQRRTTGSDPFGGGWRRRAGADARRAAQDRAVEDSMNQDLPHLAKGERVRHATFGSGTVVEVSGFGPDVRIVVNFDGVGTKKLLARYANLERDY